MRFLGILLILVGIFIAFFGCAVSQKPGNCVNVAETGMVILFYWLISGVVFILPGILLFRSANRRDRNRAQANEIENLREEIEKLKQEKSKE